MPSAQLTANIDKQLSNPIDSNKMGKLFDIINANTLMATLPNVTPNERTFTGKHSTKQISVSGTMPMEAINMMNDMQITGVQWNIDVSTPFWCRYKYATIAAWPKAQPVIDKINRNRRPFVSTNCAVKKVPIN